MEGAGLVYAQLFRVGQALPDEVLGTVKSGRRN
jgi:hypothetical protein